MGSKVTDKSQYLILIERLKLLASPYNTQINCLPDFVDVPSEVISEFTESILMLPELIENDFFSKNTIASIVRCFNCTELISRNDDLLNLGAMQNHKDWEKARKLAKECLKLMGEEYGEPNLGHVTYVEGSKK